MDWMVRVARILRTMMGEEGVERERPVRVWRKVILEGNELRVSLRISTMYISESEMNFLYASN